MEDGRDKFTTHDVGCIIKENGIVYYLVHFPLQIGAVEYMRAFCGHIHERDLSLPYCLNIGVDSPELPEGHPFGEPIEFEHACKLLEEKYSKFKEQKKQATDRKNILNNAIETFIADIREFLGSELNQVILYGSHARNEAIEDSDVDIMLLVNIPKDEIESIRNNVLNCAYDIFFETGVDIAPIIVNIDYFKYWEEDLPFYRNVKNEGILLYERK